MKLTPIKCPNCAASIKLDRQAELVSCTHCESSFFIEWPADATDSGASGQTSQPTAPRSHYYVVRGYNPFASCPFCSAQVLRTADNAGQQVECVECRQSAISNLAGVCDSVGDGLPRMSSRALRGSLSGLHSRTRQHSVVEFLARLCVRLHEEQ